MIIRYGGGSETVTNIKLTRQLGAIDTLTFDIHYMDPQYGSIVPLQTPVELIEISKDGHEATIFTGIVQSVSSSYSDNGTKSVSCADNVLSMKYSYIFYPAADMIDPEEEEDNTIKKGMLLSDAFTAIMSNHHKFPGISSVGGIGIADTHAIAHSDMQLDGMSTFEAVMAIISDQGWEWTGHGGRIQTSKHFANPARGTFETGINIMDLSLDEEPGDIYTAVFPFGGVGYNEARLTLTDSGFPAEISADYTRIVNEKTGSRAGNILVNNTLANRYGTIVKAVIFDEIVADSAEELPEKRRELVAAAEEHLENLGGGVLTMSMTVLDLAGIDGFDIDSIDLFNTYAVHDTVTGIDCIARIVKYEYSLDDPLTSKCDFELHIEDL